MCYSYAVQKFISDKCDVRGDVVHVRDSSIILCFVVVQELWRDDVNNQAHIDKAVLVQ